MENIYLAYKGYPNTQLTQSRFTSLCIIPPWETNSTDSKVSAHHLICPGTAADVNNTISPTRNNSTQVIKCHAINVANPPKTTESTIADHANEALRRINRFKKIPNTSPQCASPSTA